MFIEDKLKLYGDLNFKLTKVKDEKEKQEIEEELKSILLDLKKQAISQFSSESDIKKFLDNIIHFNKYSYHNMCLIFGQKKDAEYVASLKTFSKLGYRVNKGEKSIKILVPSMYNMISVNGKLKPYSALTDEEKSMYNDKDNDKVVFGGERLGNFRLGSVFDATQTNMPIENINKELNPILEDDRAIGIEDVFIKAMYKDNFKVEYTDKIDSGAKGYYVPDENKIVVLKGLGNLMRLKVVIHEYAHGLAHNHLKDNQQDYNVNRSKYETEAESIAYVVSKYLGLDTSSYSCKYLYSWSKEKDFKEIDDSLSTIVNYSKKIINNFDYMLEKEKSLNEVSI